MTTITIAVVGTYAIAEPVPGTITIDIDGEYDLTETPAEEPPPEPDAGDAWACQPIGVPLPMFAHLFPTLADALPPTDQAYRYLLLSAGQSGAGGYNEGIIASEAVSGSAPLTIATALIEFDGSPLDGATVHLINTEARYVIAGATAGVVRMDQFQGHTHDVKINPGYVASGSGRAGLGTQSESPNGSKPKDDGEHGAPRFGIDTHGKDISAIYVMRIV